MNTLMKTLMSQRIFNSNTCRTLFATCLSLLCLAAFSAEAATITVINANDSGAGSLRQALADTNDGDTIDFAVTGTITLTTDELLVDKSITISGPGSDNLTVDGNHASHVFHVSGGVTATVAGLSITNGGEVPGAGGGIYNDHSTLAIDHCTVSGNHGSVGGGVYNDGYSGSATLTVTNSTFSGNSVAAPYSVGSGGGIYNNGSYGSATLTVANSTFSGNSAGVADYGWGGAIYNDGSLGSATLTLNNSTFSGNSAGYFGGGIYNGSGMVTIRHTILNAGAWGENLFNAYGSVSSLGYNLSSDNGGGFLTATGDQINTDPMLGPLQDNGGPTFTHELLSGSPAIDAGDPNFTPPPYYDQRGQGYDRVANGRIDIGAFEVQASTSVCPQPQGYWKSNPDAWPVNSLALGSQNYSKTELLIILNTPVGSGKNADASLILADQLIAAKLNVANGVDPAPVSSTITHADSLLSGFSGQLPYRVRTSTEIGQAMVNDGTVLESYNNGALTSGCTP